MLGSASTRREGSIGDSKVVAARWDCARRDVVGERAAIHQEEEPNAKIRRDQVANAECAGERSFSLRGGGDFLGGRRRRGQPRHISLRFLEQLLHLGTRERDRAGPRPSPSFALSKYHSRNTLSVRGSTGNHWRCGSCNGHGRPPPERRSPDPGRSRARDCERRRPRFPRLRRELAGEGIGSLLLGEKRTSRRRQASGYGATSGGLRPARSRPISQWPIQ